MKKSTTSSTQRYQNIKDACKTTGLSMYFLRNGCKAGTVPHVRSGRVYMIDVPALYQQLEEQRVQQTGR